MLQVAGEASGDGGWQSKGGSVEVAERVGAWGKGEMRMIVMGRRGSSLSQGSKGADLEDERGKGRREQKAGEKKWKERSDGPWSA